MHKEITTRASSSSVKFNNSQHDLENYPMSSIEQLQSGQILDTTTLTVQIIQSNTNPTTTMQPETSQMNDFITTNDLSEIVSSPHTKIIVSNELPDSIKHAVMNGEILDDSNILTLPVMNSCDNDNSSLEPNQADLELKDSATSPSTGAPTNDEASQEKGESEFSFLLEKNIFSFIVVVVDDADDEPTI